MHRRNDVKLPMLTTENFKHLPFQQQIKAKYPEFQVYALLAWFTIANAKRLFWKAQCEDKTLQSAKCKDIQFWRSNVIKINEMPLLLQGPQVPLRFAPPSSPPIWCPFQLPGLLEFYRKNPWIEGQKEVQITLKQVRYTRFDELWP